MKLLPDTKEFLLFVTGSLSLPDKIRQTVEDETNEVFVSVPDTMKRHGMSSLPLEPVDVVEYRRLPAIHRDPFDRMLICQALARGLTFVTSDGMIMQYPASML